MARVNGRRDKRPREEYERNVFTRFRPLFPQQAGGEITDMSGVGVEVSYSLCINAAFDQMLAYWRCQNAAVQALFRAKNALRCAFLEVPNPASGNRHHGRLRSMAQPHDYKQNLSSDPPDWKERPRNASEIDDLVNGVADTMFYSADKVNS